jgi:hypothetical protein
MCRKGLTTASSRLEGQQARQLVAPLVNALHNSRERFLLSHIVALAVAVAHTTPFGTMLLLTL